jgi:hypothetical protein
MAEPTVTLDLLADAVRPTLLNAGFEDAGGGESGGFPYVRFRRQETRAGEGVIRLITLSHAPQDGAFLADAYLVARRSYTWTPAAKEIRRYGTLEEAEAAAAELAAAVLGWLEA